MHPRFQGPVETYRLPQPPAPPVRPETFIACPLAMLQGLTAAQQLWQSSLYQLAFEQAQAIARPSLPERDLLAVWN